MEHTDLNAFQQRALDRITDRAGPTNRWVTATRIGAISTLEQLVAKGYLVAKVAHDIKGRQTHSYRLRKDAPDAA